ncbi:DUF2971 domain-containing protein [Bosea sp. TAB14]|jgi:hypothetical protein|uniref:DUF2971 domain-containing protein n=1 Tax=Bosea sp. TAB14 TaxID=3237481 RepID=UPI003F906D41
MPGRIVDYVTPTRLYRYRSFRRFDDDTVEVQRRELAAIQEGYIWAAAYHQMNDPMEGTFFARRHGPGDLYFQTILESIREGKQRTGIACFSETPTNELMWAHYADEFRGICIAYDFSDLRDSLEGNAAFSRLFYTESPPNLDLGENDLETDVRRVLSSKSQKWGYEREWRMFTQRLGRIGYRNPATVRTIYFGHRIDPDIRHTIERLARQQNIDCSEMQLNGYRLSFDNTEARMRRR